MAETPNAARTSPFAPLRFRPEDRRAAAGAIVLAVLGVTAFICLVDGWLFRAHLSPDYVRFYTGPLSPRTFIVSVIAMMDEVKYRLLLMTSLVVLARLARIPLAPAVMWGIIVIAQFANTWALVLADPFYASIRFWAVGTVWGWLYWRHGWLSALLGHGSCHLVLDPMLLVALK